MDRHPNHMTHDWLSVFPTPTESLDYGDGHNGTGCFVEHIPELLTGGLTLLTCLCGLLGNGAILWLLGFRVRRNPFSAYLLNLALADTCFLLCTSAFLLMYHMPMLSRSRAEVPWALPLFHSMVLLTYSTSLYLLTAISVERCVGVLWPFWCRCHRPRLLSPVVCSLLWALACVLAGLVYFVCDLGHSEHCWVVLGTLCFLSFCVLTPLMVVSNVIVFIKLRRSSWQHHSLRLYAAIFLTVFSFLLFGVPLSIQIFLNFFVYINLVFEICLLLASVNSGINPIIYVLVGSYGKPRLRGSVKVALQRVFEDRADSQEVGETPVVGTAA
ncbi:PREDICTED: proto-oncogene Mas-like [Lepidothrix coronata]|uniref:Proto-oncogene Mas-like n=1 Tax=Lepidothrix coronata TaxID=321398 RepID=A0A6J0IDR5_9PASS|nr:PREDICTED: proto-oncogene Mas-like [Lepidothrix coronata]